MPCGVEALKATFRKGQDSYGHSEQPARPTSSPGTASWGSPPAPSWGLTALLLPPLPSAVHIVCHFRREGGLRPSGQGEDPGPAEHHAGVDRRAAVLGAFQGCQAVRGLPSLEGGPGTEAGSSPSPLSPLLLPLPTSPLLGHPWLQSTEVRDLSLSWEVGPDGGTASTPQGHLWFLPVMAMPPFTLVRALAKSILSLFLPVRPEYLPDVWREVPGLRAGLHTSPPSQPPCRRLWAASFSPRKAHRLTDQDNVDQQTKVDMDFIPFCLGRGEARPPKGEGVEKEG